NVDTHRPQATQAPSSMWAMGMSVEPKGPKMDSSLSFISMSIACWGQAFLQEPQPLQRSSATVG
ncbi:hypothetical protein Q6326_32405, partial [Klebsiella pneumoniae]